MIELLVETKQCPICKETLSVDCFWINRSKSDRHAYECKTCQKKRINKWRRTPTGKISRAKSNFLVGLKGKYGITVEKYTEMFVNQNGVCAICGKPEKAKTVYGTIRRLSVDHNHKTGKIRSLLCAVCNTRINIFEDEDWRFLAEKYLKSSLKSK